MVQESGGNLGAVDFPFVAAAKLMKFASRRHHTYFHRKVRAGELRFQDLTKTVRPQVFRLKTIKVETILRLEERVEEWNALDVVPVVMRHENVGFDSMATQCFRPTIPQHA